MGANFSADISNQSQEITQKATNTTINDIESSTTSKSSASGVQNIKMGTMNMSGYCSVTVSNTVKTQQKVESLMNPKVSTSIANSFKSSFDTIAKKEIEQKNTNSIIPSINESWTLTNIKQKLNTDIKNNIDTTISNNLRVDNEVNGSQTVTIEGINCTGHANLTLNQNTIVDQMVKSINKSVISSIVNNSNVAQMRSTVDSKVKQSNDGTAGVYALAAIGIAFVVFGGGGSMAAHKSSKNNGQTNWILVAFFIFMFIVFLGVGIYFAVDPPEWIQNKSGKRIVYICGKNKDGKNAKAFMKTSAIKTLQDEDGKTGTNDAVFAIDDDSSPEVKKIYHEHNLPILNKKENWSCDFDNCSGCALYPNKTPVALNTGSGSTTNWAKIVYITCFVVAGIFFILAIYNIVTGVSTKDVEMMVAPEAVVAESVVDNREPDSLHGLHNQLGGSKKKYNIKLLIILIILLFICMN